tara:strand:- start:123 stop:362 length:240 start_codon:yes stop_codon:yes gene_type:complete
MPGAAALLARVVFGLVCVLGDAQQHEPSVSVTSSLEDVFGGLVAQGGGGGGRNVIEVIEQAQLQGYTCRACTCRDQELQ